MASVGGYDKQENGLLLLTEKFMQDNTADKVRVTGLTRTPRVAPRAERLYAPGRV